MSSIDLFRPIVESSKHLVTVASRARGAKYCMDKMSCCSVCQENPIGNRKVQVAMNPMILPGSEFAEGETDSDRTRSGKSIQNPVLKGFLLIITVQHNRCNASINLIIYHQEFNFFRFIVDFAVSKFNIWDIVLGYNRFFIRFVNGVVTRIVRR